jgi:lysophospholipase L1-like esterase
MGRARSLLGRLALGLASSALCLVALEGVARVVAARIEDVPTAEGTPIARYHPRLGWENAPGGSQHLVRSEFDVTVAFNEIGMRGPDRALAKPPGVRRVLILGDSFAAGYYAEEHETLRARLETLLNGRAGGGVEVLNAGVPGYSTDQEYLQYLERGRELEPDAVVVMLFCNDLHFNTTGEGTGGRPKPYFDLLSRSEILLRNVPVPERPEPAAAGDATPPSPVTPWRGSHALGLLALRTMRGNPALHGRLEAYGLVPPLSPDPPLDFLPFAYHGRQERWAVDDMWNRTRAILGQLRTAVASDGAELVVLYVPARFEVNDEAWSWIQARYDPAREWQRGAVVERLGRVLGPLGIPLVDPRAELSAAERSAQPAYLAFDGHWNARGNALAAERLAPALRRLLAAGDEPS